MRKFMKTTLAVCIMVGGMTACGAKNDSNVTQQEMVVTSEVPQEIVSQEIVSQETMSQETVSQETASQNEPQQEMVQTSEIQQAIVPSNEKQPTTAQTSTVQQDTSNPILSGNEQISLETAKSVALTDAGVSASDVIYTKERLDYEDGIAVYDIEFYANNVEYEYEINATTGVVYSKSMEAHHNQNVHGHQGISGETGTDIGVERAKAIALNHAGFAEADVSRLKIEFDIDDGLAVYEVEFDKNGIEYEYTINAADGSIIEYDVD